MILRLIVVLFCIFQLSAGAKILAYVPVPTRSHHILFEKLTTELANRGHEVTLITPFKQSKPPSNVKEVIIPNLYKNMAKAFWKADDDQKDANPLQYRKLAQMLTMLTFPIAGSYLMDTTFSLPELQKIMKSDEKFDLILGETVMDEAFLAGFSYKHKAPIVALNTFPPGLFANTLVGNPAPSSYISDPLIGFSSKMTFLERVLNTVFGHMEEIMYRLFLLPSQDKIMRKYFGDDLPPIEDIIFNTSLILINHHFSLAFARPYLPSMIEIGGFHVDKPKPLPDDLEKYLNGSKHGAILFSMGSHLKSQDLSAETKQEILKAFSRLEQNVLWKFEDDSLVDVPKNVKISNWLPQSDILAHPNLKLFITHGGLLSTTEAVVRGVPMIGIPVIGDQPVNMKYTSEAGFGVTLDLDEITEEVLYEKIIEVLTDPKYKENVKRGSILLQDSPLSAMDKAVYWIEYVIRHKGAPHLRSAAQNLKAYQLYLVDVLGFLLVISILILLGSFYFIKFTARLLCSLLAKKSASPSIQKKEN